MKTVEWCHDVAIELQYQINHRKATRTRKSFSFFLFSNNLQYAHYTNTRPHSFLLFSLLLLLLLLSMPVVVPFFQSVSIHFPPFLFKAVVARQDFKCTYCSNNSSSSIPCGTDLLQHPNIRRRRRSIHFSMNKCFSCCFMSLLHFFLIFHNTRVHGMDYNVPNATNACNVSDWVSVWSLCFRHNSLNARHIKIHYYRFRGFGKISKWNETNNQILYSPTVHIES